MAAGEPGIPSAPRGIMADVYAAFEYQVLDAAQAEREPHILHYD